MNGCYNRFLFMMSLIHTFCYRGQEMMRSLVGAMSCFRGILLLTVVVASCRAGGGDANASKSVQELTSTYTADVTVDASIEYQTVVGWAIWHLTDWNWEGPERYPIAEQDAMHQIKDLGIDYVSNCTNELLGRAHERTNDDSDPFHYDWDNYNAQLVGMGHIFERLQYQHNAGLKYYLASHEKPAWMYDNNGHFDSNNPNMYDEFAEFWAALCIYAKNNYGLTVPYISLQIEPTWAMQASRWMGFRPLELRDAIKAVGQRLRQEGFNTMIIAPDDNTIASSEKMCEAILTDSVATSYMNCVAFHPYDNWSGRDGPDKAISALTSLANDNLVRNSGLPLWQTEWSLYKAYGDRMRDHVDELRFALDNAKMVYNCHAYGNTSLYVVWSSQYDWGYDKDRNGIIENEGIFGPGVTDGKLNLKKYGHMLRQYTKYIPPVSKRIDAVLSGASDVFVTAYKNLNTGTFTIVFINKNASTASLTVKVNNITGLSNLKAIRTSATENSNELGTIALTGNTFTTTLPGSSVTTFTGHFIIP